MTGTDTTDYVLDGSSVVRTFLNSNVDKTYLHGARGPEYERDAAGNVRWYLYDGLGSVLGTVNSNGNLLSTRKYDVYGGVRTGSTGEPGGGRHKFVGGLGHTSDDETGLIYMRARYYDPVTGRFASEDPGKSGNNWYAYAANNPVLFLDRNGKQVEITAGQWKDLFKGLFGIGVGLRFSAGFRMVMGWVAQVVGALAVAFMAGACLWPVTGMAGIYAIAVWSEMIAMQDQVFNNPSPVAGAGGIGGQAIAFTMGYAGMLLLVDTILRIEGDAYGVVFPGLPF